MDNQENDIQDPQPGAEVSPGVTPIHDETAKAFDEENAAKLKAAEEAGALVDGEVDDASPTSHNVFEQTAVTSSQPLADEAADTQLDPEKPYEGGCAS